MVDVRLGQPDPSFREVGRRRPGAGEFAWMDTDWYERLDTISATVSTTHRLWHESYYWQTWNGSCRDHLCPFVGWLRQHLYC